MEDTELYKQLFDGVIEEYRQLPFGAKELYKKYAIDLQIPQSKSPAAPNGLSRLRSAIAEASILPFDAIVSNGELESKSPCVREIEYYGRNNGKAEFSSAEERIAYFIHRDSKKSLVVETPPKSDTKLNVLFISDRSMPLEICVNAGDGSRLSLFEWFASAPEENAIVAPMHAINIGSSCDVEISILHNEDTKTVIGALSKAKVHDNSTLRLNTIYNGASVTKSTSFTDAAGKKSRAYVNELVLGFADQKFDISSYIVNSNTETTAHLRSGAALKQKSFCILKGYAKVSKGADGAYSNVEERGLVLDPDARIQPLPDMSIDHKNVSFASHSASTAPIDPESLFYMKSRGLSEEKAKRIFVASFLSKYLGEINNDIVKEIAVSILLHKLDNNAIVEAPPISMQDLWLVPSKKR